jgi:hypothetical protein
MRRRSRGFGYIEVIGVLAAITLAGGLVWSYVSAIERAKELEGQLSLAQEANISLTKQNLEIRQATAEAERRARETEEKFAAARAEKEELEQLFSKHDFDHLYQSKPQMVLRRANAATERVLNDFADEVRDAQEPRDMPAAPEPR